ncbi:HAD-IIA family hydrolase [Pinisolibacter aquiterrae]|uniref:HAD-IIA family hydrolase n=1 Tax=Pinisolibacter aquiterrae TaxID=2815579 RepID=UPI001C3C5625|nr:HAD hydrolase-like protein [Pinisolibacter aquiterrae]MBV5262427.1 HAD hydrolase-like protein [Pinisolibacter aquiterrae]MCC8235788.1 HAD hydrolase-like protein [Pinisolibacter aquiterrae]
MTRPSVSAGRAALDEARGRIAAARVVLCDVDGCLVESGAPCPGAIDFVARMGERLRLVSNNSTDLAATLAARLAAIGLPVPAERCFLAGELAVDHLAKRHPGATAMILGTAALRAKAEDLGLRTTSDWPDVVLLCNDPSFDAGHLQRLVTAAHHGVPIVVANPDRWRPDRTGRPLIETGVLLAALRAAVPNAAVTVVGKPEPTIFRAALAGIEPHAGVMIGDNRETDLVGAEAIGMAAVLIGRGRRAVAADLGALC